MNIMLTFWKQLRTAERAQLAQQCETQVVYLSQIAYGHRRASGPLAMRIERQSSGAVTRHDLRPDLYPEAATV